MLLLFQVETCVLMIQERDVRISGNYLFAFNMNLCVDFVGNELSNEVYALVIWKANGKGGDDDGGAR